MIQQVKQKGNWLIQAQYDMDNWLKVNIGLWIQTSFGIPWRPSKKEPICQHR